MKTRQSHSRGRAALLMASTALLLWFAAAAVAHPLGNFTINHFAMIEIGARSIRCRYVVDMAEISTLQELQAAGIKDQNAATPAELDSYLERVLPIYIAGILVKVDGQPIELRCLSKAISMPEGAGGLKTMRIECDLEGRTILQIGPEPRSFVFEDKNQRDRIGWRELAVIPQGGITIFNSSAYGSALTDELKSYPEGALVSPLNESSGHFEFVQGPAPAGSRALLGRNGAKTVGRRDRLAELISAPELTPAIALLGLLIAVGLGGLHALSPGHGKTVVGAYLVGSRGTARHAAFLGLTVTLTHTAGVFALGLVTLFASQYIVPETLFPLLGFVSGAIVVTIGLSLFLRRLRFVTGRGSLGVGRATEIHSHTGGHSHSDLSGNSDVANTRHSHHGHALADGEPASHVHSHDHGHQDAHQHSHTHAHEQPHHHSHEHNPESGHPHSHTHDGMDVHSHNGRVHSHRPPGADGSRITWRSLLALGISGGILPCPSALVVLLAAISLHRVGYGLLLVVAFSSGLAAVLTGIGIAFVYAGRLMNISSRMGRLSVVLPVLSALVITCAGLAICWEAVGQAGVQVFSLLSRVDPARWRIALWSAAILGPVFLLFTVWRRSYRPGTRGAKT